jgi:hypothetical protein
VGVETFTYTITSTSGRTDTATVSVYVGVDLPPTPETETPLGQTPGGRQLRGPEREALVAIPPAGRRTAAVRQPGTTDHLRPAAGGTHEQDLARHRLERQIQMAATKQNGSADLRPVDAAFALADVHATGGLDDAIVSELAASLRPDSLLFI